MNEVVNAVWGFRFNPATAPRWPSGPTVPPICPEWVRVNDREDFALAGLTCWRNDTHSFAYLSPTEILEHQQSVWKRKRGSILIKKHYIRIDRDAKPAKTRKKDTSDQPDVYKKPVEEWVTRVELPPEAAEPFRAMLHENQAHIQQLAEQAQKKFTEALADVLRMVIKRGRLSKQVDLSRFTLSWQREGDEPRFVCTHNATRASVYPGVAEGSWHLDLERPGQPVHTQTWHNTPERAMTVAERVLLEPVEPEPEPLPERSLADWAREIKRVHKAHWIDPRHFETARKSFGIVVNAAMAATRFKLVRMSFGGERREPDEFPDIAAVERDLGLPAAQFRIEEGPALEIGLYRAVSVTSFNNRELAMAEAQRIWNASTVFATLQRGSLLAAQYGIIESASRYCEWLGSCGNADEHWGEPRARQEHLLRRAILMTLEAALDLDRYRAFLGLPSGPLVDKTLINRMHHQRASNTLVPEALRAESGAWLAVNAPAEAL